MITSVRDLNEEERMDLFGFDSKTIRIHIATPLRNAEKTIERIANNKSLYDPFQSTDLKEDKISSRLDCFNHFISKDRPFEYCVDYDLKLLENKSYVEEPKLVYLPFLVSTSNENITTTYLGDTDRFCSFGNKGKTPRYSHPPFRPWIVFESRRFPKEFVDKFLNGDFESRYVEEIPALSIALATLQPELLLEDLLKAEYIKADNEFAKLKLHGDKLLNYVPVWKVPLSSIKKYRLTAKICTNRDHYQNIDLVNNLMSLGNYSIEDDKTRFQNDLQERIQGDRTFHINLNLFVDAIFSFPIGVITTFSEIY